MLRLFYCEQCLFSESSLHSLTPAPTVEIIYLADVPAISPRVCEKLPSTGCPSVVLTERQPWIASPRQTLVILASISEWHLLGFVLYYAIVTADDLYWEDAIDILANIFCTAMTGLIGHYLP